MIFCRISIIHSIFLCCIDGIAFGGIKKMRLNKLCLISNLFFILFSFSACSSTLDCDKFYFGEIDGGYKMTQGMSIFNAYDRYEGVLNIPETYNEKPIIEIRLMNADFGRGITKIVGSKNLEGIAAWAFAGNDGYAMHLQSVEFPENGNLKTIGEGAFYLCTKLHTVIVPNNFEYFGNGVFDSCVNLINLVIYNSNPPSRGHIFDYVENPYRHTKVNSSFTVYVPDDSVETYKKSVWGTYSIMPISSFDRNK